MGMIKLLQYDAEDRFGRHFFIVNFHEFRKFASDIRPHISNEVLSFIKKGEFPTDNDHIVTLNNVLGASEVYGSNNNGDAFFKSALAHRGRDYGHKTFEDGHCYCHHNNDHPRNAVGKIVLAHWNDRMARVETLSVIDREKAGKFAERIDRGDQVSISMGCKVAWDECSICGNKAPNMASYCRHLKLAMSRILPGGKKVYAVNPEPRFFDQSYVLLGADRTASHLMKVATNSSSPSPGSEVEPRTTVTMPSAWLGLRAYDSQTGERKLAADKSADMEKEVPPELASTERELVTGFVDHVLPQLEATEPVLPKEAICKLAEHEPDKVASTLLCMGMVLRPSEWCSYCFEQAGRSKEATDILGVDDDALLELCPATDDEIAAVGFSFDLDQADVKVAEIVEPWLPQRSAFEPHFSRRLELTPSLPVLEKRAIQPGMLTEALPDVLTALLAYLAYRMAVPETRLKAIEQHLRRSPALLIPLLGIAALARRALLGEKEEQPLPGQAPYTIRTAAEKKAQFPWATVALPLGGAYLASTYLRGKQRKGYPLGAFGRLLAEHPLLFGLGGVVGATKLKGLGAKGTQALGQMFPKASSAQTALLESPQRYLERTYYP